MGTASGVEPIYLQTETGVWHWCERCSRYPSINEIAGSMEQRPAPAELCDECNVLEDAGHC
jgi:hypothetical protein